MKCIGAWKSSLHLLQFMLFLLVTCWRLSLRCKSTFHVLIGTNLSNVMLNATAIMDSKHLCTNNFDFSLKKSYTTQVKQFLSTFFFIRLIPTPNCPDVRGENFKRIFSKPISSLMLFLTSCCSCLHPNRARPVWQCHVYNLETVQTNYVSGQTDRQTYSSQYFASLPGAN